MYAGMPCRFCKRQRVMEEGDAFVCEKCRRDQANGEFVPEPDPLDELLRNDASRSEAERIKDASEPRNTIEQEQPQSPTKGDAS